MKRKKTVILIDGSSYLYRAFYALPPLTSPKGKPTGAIYGFIRMLSKLMNEFNPEYIAVAFDLPGKTFRHEKFSQYKATRKETPDDLKVQIPDLKDILKKWGIKIVEIPGYEADDIIATLAKKAAESGFKVIVVTPDKDFMQLVSENVFLFNPVSEELFDREKVKEKYGVYPEQFVDYLSIIGDSVDNIKGVKGVGPKTAKKLLEEFGSIDSIMKNLDKLRDRIKEAFKEASDRLEQNRFLVKLRDDVKIDIKPENLKKGKADLIGLKEKFEELGFRSLLKEIGKVKEIEEKGKQKSLF